MDDKAKVELARDNIRSKCLWCANFREADKPPAFHCRKGLEPQTCGREFDPKQGGQEVPV